MRLTHKPILCNYYVTYRCNAKCGFCDIWEIPSPYVTFHDVKQNLIDLKKLGVKVIDFTGGEPLLHRDLDQFLALAKDLGFITTITSNGLLYPKRAEKLAGKVDMLHFSLDSADPEKHNKSRGVACFDHVMESIKIAKSLGERPDIIFTVMPSNIDEISDVYHQITRPNNLMLILNPVFEYNSVGENLNIDELNEVLSWSNKKLVYLNKGFIELRKNGGNKTSRPVCKAASSTIVISPENKIVSPCYHLKKEEIPIEGNLYNHRKSGKMQQLIKKEGTYKECEGCAINCYFQPSFAVEMNKYWFYALPSTLKYAAEKGTWKQLFN